MLEGQALKDALSTLEVEEAQGVAFRVIPAQYPVTALFGIGSLKRGGRFNPKGLLEALHLSESPVTALQEVEAIMQSSLDSKSDLKRCSALNTLYKSSST